MEKIQFDSGIRSYRINGAGVLRFNPGDPNLYSRFLEAVEKLKEVETELTQQEKTVVQLRYGLTGKGPMRQREVARLTGISRSYISRIEKKALQKLRRAIEGT